MIATALPISLITYCSSSHPPNSEYISTLPTRTNNTMHISLPPSGLTQLQALCDTEHRACVPPIDLNRPDIVSLKRGRLIIRSCKKQKSLSSGSRSAAPCKVLIIIEIDQFGVPGQPHRCILCVWSTLILKTFYLWLLGKIPCHTDHIYDLGRNIGGRQAIYMGFANTLIVLSASMTSKGFDPPPLERMILLSVIPISSDFQQVLY